MRCQRTKAEAEQIKALLTQSPTFYKVFQQDFTQEVINDLRYRLFGKIPRNFLLNIGGLIGTKSGVFKSAMGLQLALELDPTFNIKQRVSFSINDILDKLQKNTEFSLCNRCAEEFKSTYTGTYEESADTSGKKCDNCDFLSDKLILLTKLIFFLDEQTKTLKTGGLFRLQNIVDTVRQRQVCFITCGIEAYNMNFSTYHLHRVQESSDDYLPKKTVRFAVYDDARDIYYGFFKWDITPLSDPIWEATWKEYSAMKTQFQRIALSQQISSMAYEEMAQEIMESEDFQKCYTYTKKGEARLQNALVENLIIKRYSDMTNNDRKMILAEIRMELNDS